jgi:hypothetical protein
MARRYIRQPQRGAALLIFMLFMVLGMLTYLVNSVSPAEIELKRQRQTEAALAMAKEALIGYALTYREEEAKQGRPDRMYGYLPLPDMGSSRNINTDPNCKDASNNPLEGCDANTPTGITCDANNIYPTMIGRLPWRTLGTGPLRDGHGECLWLIVSSLHLRKHCSSPTLPPMNWDTLGQLDIVTANGTSALNSMLATHDRPLAIIFSPGPPLSGQDRCTDKNNPAECPFAQNNDVTQCGGNYNATNYVDPAIATALGGITNYLAGTAYLAYLGQNNHESGTTGDSILSNDPDDTLKKSMLVQGKVFKSGSDYLPGGCTDSDCNLLANDTGLSITSDQLFGAIRKSAYFRQDINSMLDRMVSCLRDSTIPVGYGHLPDSPCYDESQHPLGYYTHYKEMIFLSRPSGAFSVNANNNCTAALFFAGQRSGSQQRITSTQKNDIANYLEGTNSTGFAAITANFVGETLFRASPPQTTGQDIVHCIPNTPSMNQVMSPTLDSLGGQLTSYDPGSRTLTLGRLLSISDEVREDAAGAFFGCSWMPETHSMGSGFRSYFKFQITNTGHGFTFAVIDGGNSAGVCGAEAEQLGYSGTNGITTIDPPKIGIEIDTSKNASRADPDKSPSNQYGHLAIVYWGTENTSSDDNVHGLPTPPDPKLRPAPRNPSSEDISTANTGIAYLPGSSIPTTVIHMRVEVNRIATDTALHSNTYQVDAWLENGDSHGDIIAAMKNTTRPFATLYANADSAVSAHIRDTPTIHDKQGGACTADSSCPAGQICGTDNLCYTRGFDSVRLGFTTAQSSSTDAKDQIIKISDFVTTWLP